MRYLPIIALVLSGCQSAPVSTYDPSDPYGGSATARAFIENGRMMQQSSGTVVCQTSYATYGSTTTCN